MLKSRSKWISTSALMSAFISFCNFNSHLGGKGRFSCFLSSVRGVSSWNTSIPRAFDRAMSVLSLTHARCPSIQLTICTERSAFSASFSWEKPSFFLLALILEDNILLNWTVSIIEAPFLILR
jgi:hypothetical protein